MELSMIVNLSILGFMLLCLIIGLIKGLFKSVITIIILIASIFIGSYASTPLTPKAVDKIYPKIETKAIELIEEQAKTEENQNKLLKIAKDMGLLNTDELIQKLTVENKEQIETDVKEAISPATRIVIWVIIAILAFIVLSLISVVIGKAINDTPGVKTVNRLLGACLGLVTGAAIVWGLCYLVSAIGINEKILTLSDNSEVLQFLLDTIPEAAHGKFAVITLPIIGEVNLLEMFGK